MKQATDLNRIFNVNDIEEGIKETYDAAGTGVSHSGSKKSDADLRDSYIPTSMREDPQATVQEERHVGDSNEVSEDAINPSHYRKHPSGIECIEVVRHMNFNTGNAIKYIWRYQDKGDPVENLKKAQWYLDDEIRRLEGKR